MGILLIMIEIFIADPTQVTAIKNICVVPRYSPKREVRYFRFRAKLAKSLNINPIEKGPKWPLKNGLFHFLRAVVGLGS